MTPSEAIAIIRKEYLCVDRDCDIERSCGKCDLMMPSKEPILQAYKMAIQALETQDREQADRDYISRAQALNTWCKQECKRDFDKCLVTRRCRTARFLLEMPSVAIPKERGEHERI